MSFTAAFLTAQSKTRLVEWWESTFPDKPLLSRKHAEHFLIKFQPNHSDMVSTPLGAIVTIEVIGYAADSRGQAVVVRCRRVYSSNEIPHITVATDGCAPVYSKELLRREWTPIDHGPQLFGIVNQGQGRHATHVSASALRLVAAIDAQLPYPDSSLTTLHSSSATQLHASDRLAEELLELHSLHTERCGPKISTHQLKLFANMRLEELTEELLKVLKTLPPSDISIDFTHTSWPLHRYVLASYSPFLTKSIYGTTEAPNVVNSLHISNLSPALFKGNDVSGSSGGSSDDDDDDAMSGGVTSAAAVAAASANESDGSSSDEEIKPKKKIEENVSEESALIFFLLFYKHELAAAESRRLYEQRSVSLKKLLTLLQYAMKWDIQDLVTALIEMLKRKMERMNTIAELLEFEQRIKKMELPSVLEIKVSKTVWRFVWKLIGGQPNFSNRSSHQSSNDGSLSLPLDNPIVLEVAQHVADLAAIEEDSNTSPEKSLFELEMKLMSHFEKLALEEEQQKRRLEKEKKTNKSSDASLTLLPKDGDILFAINDIKLESMVDDVHELSDKAVEMVKTMGRPIKITFRDPSMQAMDGSKSNGADGKFYDVSFEEEKLGISISVSNDGFPVVVSKLTDDDDDTKCAICLETMTSSDTVITLTCDHLFHRDCISKLTNHRQQPHSYRQSSASSSRSFKCPLCRCLVEMPSGGLLSRSALSSTRCQTEGCSFVKHSLPLPSHFTASGGNYCCDYCRTSGHGHGTHCERIVDLPREEEEEEANIDNGDNANASPSSPSSSPPSLAAAAEEPAEIIRPSASATLAQDDVNTVAHWVKLFSKILKGREDKKRAKLKLESCGISNLDDSFLRKVTACLLQNIVSNRHAAEATTLVCQNDFALLFKYIQLCNRDELVQIISMSDVLGLGIEHYQKALLLSKPNNETRTPVASSHHHEVYRQAHHPEYIYSYDSDGYDDYGELY